MIHGVMLGMSVPPNYRPDSRPSYRPSLVRLSACIYTLLPTTGLYVLSCFLALLVGDWRSECRLFFFLFFLWEREGMRHAPSRLGADVEDSIRARQIGLRPLDGSALCPTP